MKRRRKFGKIVAREHHSWPSFFLAARQTLGLLVVRCLGIFEEAARKQVAGHLQSGDTQFKCLVTARRRGIKLLHANKFESINSTDFYCGDNSQWLASDRTASWGSNSKSSHEMGERERERERGKSINSRVSAKEAVDAATQQWRSPARARKRPSLFARRTICRRGELH